MAVSKIWKVTVRLAQVIDYALNPEKTAADNYTPEQYQALADVLQYAKDEEKTEREFFVDGINCNPSTARDQFVTVKEQFGKPDGIQAYHGYLSFKEQNISPELAQKIGMEFAQTVWGKRFQVVVTTHLNTKHLHCHFVVNSVSFVDGKRLANEEKAWFKFRHIADELCKKYELHYIPNPVRGNSNSYYYQLRKAGMPDRYDRTRSAIDDAISKSRTMKEFEYVLDQMGYKYQLSESLKYWTVVPKGWQKPIRLYRLGEDYTNDRIKERIKENRDKVDLEPYQKPTYQPRQYRLATREHRIRKKGGLYGLYLHYCYKTVDEMASQYGFNQEQKDYLTELLKPQNNSLWAAALYGINYSDDQIVTVALTQIGNVGGDPYWSWYGFGSRVEWCACFVSWCANECGYIDTGVIPKYAGCVNGVQWFKDRGQWVDGSAEPVAGMIIFFDWDSPDGSSGPQDGQSDHTGIVQKVENGIVYTVEGNSGGKRTTIRTLTHN